MSESHSGYYLPEPSSWPIRGSIGLFLTFGGAAIWLNGADIGGVVMGLGIASLLSMFFGWFGTVIRESLAGAYNKQVDVSFRWGMAWFIFSEVMFFAAFFGALFYSREFSVAWLGGHGWRWESHSVLWPHFAASWPMSVMPDPSQYNKCKSVMPPWGIPAINTLILLSSGATVTFAHWAMKKNHQRALCFWLFVTFALGFTFLTLQAHEYMHAYTELGLTLHSGIYGTTFFMLTGFHGLHVTIGATMLVVIWLRALKGHFTPDHHFAFEGVAWYWHFVDVVWLFLFIFVYWL